MSATTTPHIRRIITRSYTRDNTRVIITRSHIQSSSERVKSSQLRLPSIATDPVHTQDQDLQDTVARQNSDADNKYQRGTSTSCSRKNPISLDWENMTPFSVVIPLDVETFFRQCADRWGLGHGFITELHFGIEFDNQTIIIQKGDNVAWEGLKTELNAAVRKPRAYMEGVDFFLVWVKLSRVQVDFLN